jgi:hypothetical protein
LSKASVRRFLIGQAAQLAGVQGLEGMSLKKNNAKRPTDARSIPTLQDVAERAGVSTATVSRCLNTPDLVVDSTRDRVMKAVRELGYAPNYGAQISGGQTHQHHRRNYPDYGERDFCARPSGLSGRTWDGMAKRCW